MVLVCFGRASPRAPPTISFDFHQFLIVFDNVGGFGSCCLLWWFLVSPLGAHLTIPFDFPQILWFLMVLMVLLVFFVVLVVLVVCGRAPPVASPTISFDFHQI